MTNTKSKIIYTHTDEAPALATYSFLPIIQTFARAMRCRRRTAGYLAGGPHHCCFPERLTKEQQIPDALTELGELAKRPEANIIKLPNISASIPQLKAAIAELQKKGYDAAQLSGLSRATTQRRTFVPVTTRSREAPSIRCCARETPTGGRPTPSSSMPERIRIPWVHGLPTRSLTSQA